MATSNVAAAGVSLDSGGGQGGGLTLGPPTNSFTAATQAAAETLRDTYALANADWLAQYDAEPTFLISINWPATPTNTVYQSRRSSSWATVTPLIRGEEGSGGTPGMAGAAGGGALDLLGVFTVTVGNANDDIFLDMGFDWPTARKWLVYKINGRAYWLDGADIYDTTDGVTASAVGTASAAATRVTIWENVANVIIYLGRTAANRALIEYSSNIGAITIEFYAYIPSEAQSTGGGVGTGVTESRVQQLINGTSLSALQGQVTDTQVLDAITRDAELTAAITALVNGAPADRNTLNELSTVINLRAPLNSPSLTGIPVAPTAAAGTNTTQVATSAYVVAAIAAALISGGADGVLASAALQADGVTLRLTLSDGTDIDVNLMDIISGIISGVTANEGLDGGGTSGDVTIGIADSGITYAKLAAAAILQIRENLALISNVAALAGATFTGSVAGITPTQTAHFTTKEYVDAAVMGTVPSTSHDSFINVKADTVPTAANAQAGNTFTGNSGPIPAYTGAMHVLFYRPVSAGDFTGVFIYATGSPNTINQISAWTQSGSAVSISGEDHNALYSDDTLTGAGGFTVEVV